MGKVLVVDGSDICRAPIVAFTLLSAFNGFGWLASTAVGSRGLTTEADRTMCENASARLGFSGPAIAFYGAHRAEPLAVADIAAADLVLTAERAQRSAVVRMVPGTQATVFTWKEALVLSSVLVERRRTGALSAPADVAALARALHGARGTVPLIEPPVRTGVFHWRRAETDPLTIESGHDGHAEHRTVTQESLDVAIALGRRIVSLVQHRPPEAVLDRPIRRERPARRSV